MKSLRPLLTTPAAVLTAVLSADAANFTWDTVPGDGTGVTAGNGTWDTTPGNIVWNDGTTPNVVWANGNTAIFGGADGSYAINVASGLSAAGITFNASGYTLGAAGAT